MCHMIIEALKCQVEVIWRFEVFRVNGVKKQSFLEQTNLIQF